MVRHHIVHTRHIKLCPVIGVGFWKDVYLAEKTGVSGYTLNVIIPFVRIQIGRITFTVTDTVADIIGNTTTANINLN